MNYKRILLSILFCLSLAFSAYAMTARQKELCEQIIPQTPYADRSLGGVFKQSLKETFDVMTFGVFEDSVEEKLGKIALNLADIFGWETTQRYDKKQLGSLIVQSTEPGRKYLSDRAELMMRYAGIAAAGAMKLALSDLEARFLNSVGWKTARDFDRGEFVELPQMRGFWRKL